jgi:hypothetical protein
LRRRWFVGIIMSEDRAMSEASVDLAAYYNGGMSWSEFVGSARENVERMRVFYDDFDFDEDTTAFFNGRTPLQVLAIVEDWCPDVALNVAMLAKIADEVPGMELSLVRRDENPGLMDAYLSEGRRRVPTIVFMDMTFRELARWSGRSKSADAWILGEVTRDRGWDQMTEQERASFHEEYDRRFRERYAREALAEWQMLLEDEEF